MDDEALHATAEMTRNRPAMNTRCCGALCGARKQERPRNMADAGTKYTRQTRGSLRSFSRAPPTKRKRSPSAAKTDQRKNAKNWFYRAPTLAEFAVNIGVHRDTLHQWAKRLSGFSDAYQRAKGSPRADSGVKRAYRAI